MQEGYYAQNLLLKCISFQKSLCPLHEVSAIGLDWRPSSDSGKGPMKLANNSSTKHSRKCLLGNALGSSSPRHLINMELLLKAHLISCVVWSVCIVSNTILNRRSSKEKLYYEIVPITKNQVNKKTSTTKTQKTLSDCDPMDCIAFHFSVIKPLVCDWYFARCHNLKKHLL